MIRGIITALCVVCICNAGPSNFTEEVTALDTFTNTVAGLVRLANGVILQAKLLQQPDDVNKATAELLHVNPSAFSDMMKLKLEKTIENLDHLHNESVKNPTKAKFEKIATALELTNNIIKNISDLRVGIREKSIKKYMKAVDDLRGQTTADSFNCFENVRSFVSAIECFKEADSMGENRVRECHRAFVDFSNKIGLVAHEFQYCPKRKHMVERYIDSMKGEASMEQISMSVEGLVQLMQHSETLISIGGWIEDAERELGKYEGFMRSTWELSDEEDFRKLVNSASVLHEKTSIGFTEGLPEGAIDLARVFDDIQAGGILEALLVGEKIKNLEKLREVLGPLKLYSDEMTRIHGSFGNWQNITSSDKENLAKTEISMKRVGPWNAANTLKIAKSSIDRLKSCITKNSLNLKPLDLLPFRNASNYAIHMNSSFQSYLKAFRNLESLATQASKLRSFSLKDSISEKSTKFRQEVEAVIRKIRKDEKVKNALMKIYEATMANKIILTDHSNLIPNHPNMTDFEDIHRKVRESGLFKMIECLSNGSKELENAEKVLIGAAGLQGLSENYTKTVISRLESVLEVQKIFFNGTADYWRNLTDGTRRRRRQAETGDAFRIVADLQPNTIKLSEGLETLTRMRNAHKKIDVMKKSLELKKTFPHDFYKEWDLRGRNLTTKMVKELETLEEFLDDDDLDLVKIKKVFVEVSLIHGVKMDWTKFDQFSRSLRRHNQLDALNAFETMRELKLDFVHSPEHWQLIDSYVENIGRFLEKVCSPTPEVPTTVITATATIKNPPKQPTPSTLLKHVVGDFPLLHLILLVLAALLVIFILVVFIYSLTPGGRKRCKRYYLARYASMEVLELYWRYSFFTDQESDKNALCAAVREINYDQVKELVNRGAYVNVFNSFGNTPLHMAVSYGCLRIVKILVMAGADRSAYNEENKTPEMVLADCFQSTTTVTTSRLDTTTRKTAGMEQMGSFDEIEKLFEKYRKKKFRPRVPELLPTMAYRIRIDVRIDNHIADQFTELYRGNVTDQKSGVTHFIVPTRQRGIFESDDFGYIMCVFLPTMLMQEQWMAACLEKKSSFRNDFKFRVEKVKYKGVVYDTVLQWARWVHKQMLPFLYGVQFHVAIPNFGEVEKSQLKSLVEMHGAVWSEEMPVKEDYNLGSHPFHHFKMGPLFVIHDGKTNLDHLKNDVDKMFTLMTFDQFIIFMLKLQVTYDPDRKMPIPVSNSRAHQEESAL